MSGTVDNYQQTQKVYAERYGCKSVRTIKGWVKAGRDAGDPCPLDDAAAMKDWWSRVKSQRVPDRILEAAGELKPAVDSAAPATDLPLFNQPAPELPPVETGLRGSVIGLRDAEVRARQAYLEAAANLRAAESPEREQQLEGKVERLRRAWSQLAEDLRKAEGALTKLEKDRGDVLDKHVLRSELQRIHGAIYTGIKNMVRRVRPKLDGKLPMEQDHVWGEEVNRLFQAYQDGDYTPGFVTDDA